MKKALLLSFISMLISVSLSATDYYYYRFRFTIHETNINGEVANYPIVTYSPVLCGTDIITAIDGVSTRNLSDDAVCALFETKPSVTFTIKRWNKEFNDTLTGLPCICHPLRVFSEDELLSLYDNEGRSDMIFSRYEEYRDKNVDFFKYKTYDLEFSEGGCPDMYKKQFADELIQKLSSFGLKRDTENPQILFVTELFSGRKEQYNPPTTSISTQYKYGYDIFKGWGAYQYVTSEQNAGYTSVSNMFKITVSAMDVAQMKKKASIPPVIWSINCNREYGIGKTIMDFAEFEFFSQAFLSFKPLNVFICPLACNWAYYLGIYFDGDNPSVVAAVDPDGPAAKAGLKAGSRILAYKNIYSSSNVRNYGNKYIPSKPIPSYSFEKLWRSREEEDVKDEIPIYHYLAYSGNRINIDFQDNGRIVKAKDIIFMEKYFPVYILE
jgi:hypothetical protein